MTKVECPAPGFKGLKWKWIQDHAKEQQEREKERPPPGQPPAQHLDLREQPLQQDGAISQGAQPERSSVGQPSASAQYELASSPPEQHSGLQRHSGGGASQLTQPACPVKVEVGQQLSLPGSQPASVAAAPSGQAPPAQAETKLRTHDEAPKSRATGPQPPAAPNAATGDASGNAQAGASSAPSVGPVAGGQTATAGLTGSPRVSTGTATSVDAPLPGTATAPAVSLGRKSSDAADATHAPAPATAATMTPTAIALPTQQATALAAGSLTLPNLAPLQAAAGSVPASAPTQPTASVQATAPPAAASTIPAAAAAAAASTGVPAPNPATASTAAARLRLPPTRAPSAVLAPAKAKGGDDFESMFTPLSSLPVAKAETPREGACGGASRASSLVLGPHTGAAGVAGGSSGGAAGVAAVDAGERKVPLKKASRLPDSRSVGTQPPPAEPTDADNGPTSARSRTPAAQAAPASCLSPREPASGGAATGGSHRAQTQPHGQAQQQQHQPASGHPQQQQQRPSSAKHVARGELKEASRGGREQAETVAGTATTPAGGSGSQAAAAGTAIAGRAAGTDKGAGTVGGETADRKRPRTESAKPKAVGPSATGGEAAATALAEAGLPYSETLADRVKRTKRTTTSSSDHDGPHSLGNSAERAPGQGTPTAGGCVEAQGGEGAGAVPPRPATSAEAQSRGAEALHASASNRQKQCPGGSEKPGRGPGGRVGGSSAAAAAASKPQQGQHQPPGHRDKPPGRGDEPPGALGPSERGAEKGGEQQQQPSNAMRASGGGAATDSSCGGAGAGGGPPAASQRGPTAPTSGKTTGGNGSSAGAGGVKRHAEAPTARRPAGPPAKLPRTDPHLPRPHAAHGLDRRSGSGAPAAVGADAAANAPTATNGRTTGPPPPPPSGKPPHRTPGVKVEPAHAAAEGQAQQPSGVAAAATGAGAGSGRSPPAPPPPRPGRAQGDADMPAAGSCKGAVAGSRGSKDGMGDKGACGPRGGGAAAACGAGAATTTTEPKTDSDTRTPRMVECFFEFEQPCRILGGGSASVSGLGSSGSLQGLPGMVGRGAGGGGMLRAGMGVAAAPATPQHLDLGKIRTFKELWAQLAALYDGVLPDEMDSKIIYLDEEGDWIMVTPDEPWSSVAAAATKMLITNRT
ncbi:hypothetical protein Agub_g12974 [Astrephomene gubernaculifera]|uniref:PB1 domain-containing protein n=1 Tax=Astrephomene gubernaculifera TaxID=47775 RepID=A0AAD3E0N5_9CHLO|nr:hypothetical protein Agub_g12974 [Astrephomene gubernaculifera]